MAATRYVKSTGTTTGDFTKPGAPAKTIAAALKAAAPGDTIEILDAAVYAESELVVNQPITITSTYLKTNPTADPTSAGFNAKLLPTIAAKAAHRVIRIQGTPSTRQSIGAITLRGVIISKGHSIHTRSDPGIGCGGGVVVIDADPVTIDRCIFSGNRTEAAPVTGWPEPDRVALRQAILDLLGDIFTTGTETAINKLIDAVNAALKLMGKTPLAYVSRAAILAEVGKSFDTKVVPGRANGPITGQAFGGGLATVWASPTISYCLFNGNSANGRGGALAVTGYGWPTIDHCAFDNNATLPNGRSDGGGIGCEVAVPTKLGRDLYEVDLVRFLVGKIGAVRAGIASPISVLSSITISDLIAYVTWLADPFAPNPIARGIVALLFDAIGQQWSALADHALYFAMSTALSISRWDAWDRAEIDAAKKTSINVKSSRLTRNHSFDDGGGIYASVLSHVEIKDTDVSNNIADNMGGGIRLSMGSSAVISGCTVKGNSSGLGGTKGHDKGGGLAARNVDLDITNTVFGVASASAVTAPLATSNVSGNAPGGGIAFEASSEGKLAGINDLWTSILVEVFDVRAVDVAIGAGCTVGANCAGFDTNKKALSSPDYAKGGGLFALRGDFPDAPTLTLTVTSVKTTIASNLALTKGYTSRAQRGLTVTSANEVSLQDLKAHTEFTENNWGTLVDGSGTLKF